MQSRRAFLMTTVAAGLAGASAETEAAQPSATTIQLRQFVDRLADHTLRRSPETATQLGLDRGARAGAKKLLDDRSLGARDQDRIDSTDRLATLRAMDRGALNGLDGVNYDTLAFVLAGQADYARRFNYGDGPGAPYPISQISGAYQSAPDFLDSQHAVVTREDAEAYLARLEAFARVLGQETEKAYADAKAGAMPPDFVVARTLAQLTALANTPVTHAALVQSLVKRTKARAIPGDWSARATQLYRERVQPALRNQIALLDAMKGPAPHEAGVWRLPDGDACYAAALRDATTTDMTPDDVHRTGLELVASLSAELDGRLAEEGFSQGGVGARLRALYDAPQYRYPNTDAGRAQLLGDLNLKVAAVRTKLPAWFHTLPKAAIEIRRIPAYTEASAAGGYYQAGALDGSRPGAYYINLRDTAEVPTWTLPTLTYHEAIPGHHLQLSLQQEANLPLIRKILWFSAYGEGWALYAEELAGEMRMYDDDPMGRIGYLHDALFRAVRLVVDTGLHHKRWSREEAIAYYVDKIGDPEASAISEVERYCVWPGQACSYMVGKLTWLRLRDRAKAALGAAFDIRAFHDAGLLCGPTPLTVLDAVIADYTKTAVA
jgi:uncharacterized protein (DUF885 family)